MHGGGNEGKGVKQSSVGELPVLRKMKWLGQGENCKFSPF